MESGSTGSRSSSMESRAISPSETALPYAHPPLAPSDPMEERRSGGEVVRVRGGAGGGRRCGGGHAAAGGDGAESGQGSRHVGEDLRGGARMRWGSSAPTLTGSPGAKHAPVAAHRLPFLA
ncbi:loricrin-like [Triticum aestivum]|uniref:loricrin-like n=1 Tax=Triticum aestivum TaxID=4565 RepID=UPI001D0035E8|nr:loricrin-like [Triticum aestivum]